MKSANAPSRVYILGAGPAGLASAYFYVRKGFQVTVIERSNSIGGLSRGISFLGAKYDLGPHSFFANYSAESKAFFDFFIGRENYTVRTPCKLIQTARALFYSPFRLSSVVRPNNLAFFTAYGFYRCAAMLTSNSKKSVLEQHGYWLRKMIYEPYCRKYFDLDAANVSPHFLELLYAAGESPDNSMYVPNAGYIGKLWEQVYAHLLENGVRFEFNQTVSQVDLEHNKVVQVHTGTNVFNNVDRLVSSIPIEATHNLLFPTLPFKAQLRYRATIVVLLEVASITTDALYLTNYDPSNLVGRISFCSNWKTERSNLVVSAEIWCNETDAIYGKHETEITDAVIVALSQLSVIKTGPNPQYKVIKIPKCVPVLEQGYRTQLTNAAESLQAIGNLELIGRHGKFQWDGLGDVIHAAHHA